MNKIIIDYIENIEVDFDNAPIDNLQALDYLQDGIFHLAGLVKTKEARNTKSSGVGESGYIPGKETQFYWSNTNSENNLLLNQFNWFVISCINYIRIVALVDIMMKNNWKINDIKGHTEEIKKYCSGYTEKVIPELLRWRNKISAHPSAADPRVIDNIGLLEFSLMNQLTFASPHYYVGGFNWSNSGEESDLAPWSLIEVFENRLIPRYWPDIQKVEKKAI